MYKQLFVLVQLTTGLVITGCLVTAQANDISYNEQIQRLLNVLSTLVQQNDKRLNLIDSPLKALEGSVGTCFVTSHPSDCAARSTTGSKVCADILNQLDLFIKSRGESNKKDIELKDSDLNDIISKVQELANATQGIKNRLKEQDSTIKSIEDSIHKSIKKSQEREEDFIHQTNSKVDELAKATQHILTFLENHKLSTKPCGDQIPDGTLKNVTVFTLVTDEKNWYQAFADCRRRGMNLASVETEEEYQEVLRKIRTVGNIQSYWLSATNLIRDDKYVWMSTGRDVVYNKWSAFKGTQEPDRFVHPNGEVEHCMELRHQFNFEMNDNTCETPKYYVCENRPSDVSSKPSLEVSKQKGKVFTIVNSKKVNWFEALVDCKRQGLRLATIESATEQEEVVNLINAQVGHISSEVSWWLSGSDLGRKATDYVWMTSGQPLHYNAWYRDSRVTQPSHKDPGTGILENCIAMRKGFDFKWNDDTCNEKNFYICDNQN